MVFKVVYDKSICIGAGECATRCPARWALKNDGKAELIGSTLNAETGKFELTLDDSELPKQQEVVGACPGECIKVEKA